VIPEDKVKELKEQHGELVCVTVGGSDLVFRRPNRTEYDRWFDQMQVSKEQSSRHARELAKACRVYPDETGFDAAINLKPAALTTDVINAVTELAGLASEETAIKKL
jgi:hypothetical protein